MQDNGESRSRVKSILKKSIELPSLPDFDYDETAMINDVEQAMRHGSLAKFDTSGLSKRRLRKNKGKKLKKKLAQQTRATTSSEQHNEDITTSSKYLAPEVDTDQLPNVSSDEEIALADDQSKSNKKASVRPGIIFMSTIPYRMTVRRIRREFEQYGELGRVFLQREVRMNAEGRREKFYAEGWIEFQNKSLAKRIAASFNNSIIGGRKRSGAHDALWNLKYLPRFKWVHLHEQLAYENAVKQQRLRAEVSQARKEASFFVQQIEKGKHLQKLEEMVLKKGGLWERYQRQMHQNDVIQPKPDKKTPGTVGDSLLGMLMGGREESDDSA